MIGAERLAQSESRLLGSFVGEERDGEEREGEGKRERDETEEKGEGEDR